MSFLMLSHPSQEHDISIYSISFCSTQYSFKILFIWVLHYSCTFTFRCLCFFGLETGIHYLIVFSSWLLLVNWKLSEFRILAKKKKNNLTLWLLFLTVSEFINLSLLSIYSYNLKYNFVRFPNKECLVVWSKVI